MKTERVLSVQISSPQGAMNLTSIMMIIITAVVGAFDAATSDHSNSITIPDAKNIALAVNSKEFLQELVRLKDTVDEVYYQEHGKIGLESQILKPLNNPLLLSTVSTVEYTGKLWFLKQSRVKFQEKLKIVEVSHCGRSVTIECVTKYKTAKSSEWIDCAIVSCNIVDDKSEGFQLNVRSDLLIKIPLLGLGGSIRKKISGTFENAVNSFLGGLTCPSFNTL